MGLLQHLLGCPWDYYSIYLGVHGIIIAFIGVSMGLLQHLLGCPWDYYSIYWGVHGIILAFIGVSKFLPAIHQNTIKHEKLNCFKTC